MRQTIARIALVVPDYDEGIAFYCGKLGFDLLEDTALPDGKRWVVVRPKGASETALLLARAADDRQTAAVGNQTGGRVSLFLYTDDFERDYAAYRDKGVTFVRPPREMPYGKVAVFRDLYGNLWDLLEPKDGVRP